ncbi:hypothetical protein [Streptomyces sp. GbtcB7]|nr:hypothetical protein [Streptomyces sp. GbtcB7]
MLRKPEVYRVGTVVGEPTENLQELQRVHDVAVTSPRRVMRDAE